MLSKLRYFLRGIVRRLEDTAGHLVETSRDGAWKSALSFLTSAATGGFTYLLWDYPKLGSFLSFIIIGWLLFIFCIVWTRFKLWAIPAILLLMTIVPINFFSASHYIASDQFRLRYRSVEGVRYFEFPSRWKLLTQFAKGQKDKELIEITNCGDSQQTVATLPLLPLASLQDPLRSPFTFRRLPSLKIETFDFSIHVASGSSFETDGHKHSISAQFSFPSSDPVISIPVTAIFPRSTKCIVNGVPLLPILEQLPWDSDDTDSLIEAVTRSEQLRKLYRDDQVLSVKVANDLQRNFAHTNSYKALFDFVFYSVAFQSLQGNVLSVVRARIGDKLCSIASTQARAFNGPFSSLPEQFQKTIVGELGSRYLLAYPSCHMSNDRLEMFQHLVGGEAPNLPSYVTFRDCLETSASVEKCLGQDDLAQPRKGCNQPLPCDVKWTPEIGPNVKV